MLIYLIKKKYDNQRMNEAKIDDIVRFIAEAKVPVLNETGEFEYVQCETIVYGDERFDELIESSNNPDSW